MITNGTGPATKNSQSVKLAFELLSKTYPEKAEQLLKVFPDFDPKWDQHFCYPGDLLSRDNTDHKYTVMMDKQRQELLVVNISLGYTFKTRLAWNIFNTQRTNHSITLAMFKKLCCGINIAEFRVTNRSNLSQESWEDE